MVLLGLGSGAIGGPLMPKYQSEHPKTSKILVSLVLFVFSKFLLVFVSPDWYLFVFLHVLLDFVRKPMIYYGFSRSGHEIVGFALVLPGSGSSASGGLVGCPSWPPQKSTT